MSPLARYMLRETLRPTLAALLVTTFLLLTTQLLRIGEAAFGYGLTFLDFSLILALLLPRFFVFTLPIAVLIGVGSGLGRLADDREIMAMEALGTSPLSMWGGPAVLGLGAATLALGLTVFGEPWALRGLSERLARVVEKNLVQGIEPGIIHEEIPGLVIYARDRHEVTGLKDVFLRIQRSGSEATVVAESARIVPTGRHGLSLEMRAGELLDSAPDDQGDPSLTRVAFDRGTITIDIDRTVRRRVRFIGELDTLDTPSLAAAARDDRDPEAACKAETMLHRRFVIPGACLALALLAVPLGIGRALRSGRKKGLAFVLGVAAVLLFFSGLRMAESVACSLVLPIPLTLWIPNLLAAGVAIFALRKRAGR